MIAIFRCRIFDGFLPRNEHKMSDLLFTQAGIGLTKATELIVFGIVTDVFETELFGKYDR